MLMLDRLARHCVNIQLPYIGAHISRSRRYSSLTSANKRLVASVPEDRLQQAQRAMEALGNLQPKQQEPAAAAAVSEQDILEVMQRSKSKSKHKRDLPLDAAQQEAVRRKIAASLTRKASKPKFNCPACGVTLTRADNVLSHMRNCCADLLQPEMLSQGHIITDTSRLQQTLSEAAILENFKRRQALEITFLNSSPAATDEATRTSADPDNSSAQQLQQPQSRHSTAAAADPISSSSDLEDDDDIAAAADGDAAEADYEAGYSKHTRQRIQQAPADIAQEMGLPLARAERLLRQAMRTVPIAIDTTSKLDVVYEDSDFIAVNKPVGYHTAPIHRWQGGSMVNMLLGHLQQTAAAVPDTRGQQSGSGQQQQQQSASHQPHAKPYVLHRLDYNTSGLLLFGKRREVVPGVSAQFRERRVKKAYLAVTVGVPQQQSFTVDAPIDRHPQHDTARRIASTGKHAVTDVRLISANPDFDLRACPGFSEGELFGDRGGVVGSEGREGLQGVALVECFPRTGRTHQIRLHMAHVGHPLIGDEVYGVTGDWISRQALHAWTLQLAHPLSGEQMRFMAPLHDDFKHALKLLGLTLTDVE